MKKIILILALAPALCFGQKIGITQINGPVKYYPPSGGITIGYTGVVTIGNLTFADAGGDTTTWVVLSGNQTGASAPVTSGGLTFNALTAALTVGGPLSAASMTLSAALPVASGGTGITAFGTGVATALGVNTGSVGAFVVNGGALGTPLTGTLTNATGLPITAGTTGTLGIARGGTGATTFGDFSTIYYNSGVLAGVTNGTANQVLHGGGSGAPSYSAVDLVTNVQSILTGTNGGTGANNGSFVLTVPATGTAALLGTANIFTGIITLTPAVRSSGVASYLTINAPADTGITLNTESIGVNFATATRTFADGTVALQRERFFAGPTYNKTTTSLALTDAFNLYLTPPVFGSGVTGRGHTLGIVDSTSASSAITGGLVVATTLGTAATSVGIGGGNIYAGGSVLSEVLAAGATGLQIRDSAFAGSFVRMKATTSGWLRLSNTGDNDFARIQFGGTTTSFPALNITTGTQTITAGLADGTAGGAFVASGTLTVTGAVTQTAKTTTYNNIATVSNGIPAEYATVDLTAQTAAKTATTIYTPAATGMFRVSVYLQVTTAASTSSVLGGTAGVVIAFSDGDGNVAQSDTVALMTTAGAIAISSATNTTATNLTGSMIIYARTGVPITYAIDYTSVGVTPMAYAAHLKVEAL